MIYIYHPHARQELNDAANHYDSIDLKLGDDFLEEIDDCISRILIFPLAWAKVRHGSVRRCRTHRFPYSLIYDLEENQVFILAVMHESREPNYWVDRL
jgi:plasmid stabilization system protein ParE